MKGNEAANLNSAVSSERYIRSVLRRYSSVGCSLETEFFNASGSGAVRISGTPWPTLNSLQT